MNYESSRNSNLPRILSTKGISKRDVSNIFLEEIKLLNTNLPIIPKEIGGGSYKTLQKEANESKVKEYAQQEYNSLCAINENKKKRPLITPISKLPREIGEEVYHIFYSGMSAQDCYEKEDGTRF